MARVALLKYRYIKYIHGIGISLVAVAQKYNEEMACKSIAVAPCAASAYRQGRALIALLSKNGASKNAELA